MKSFIFFLVLALVLFSLATCQLAEMDGIDIFGEREPAITTEQVLLTGQDGIILELTYPTGEIAPDHEWIHYDVTNATEEQRTQVAKEVIINTRGGFTSAVRREIHTADTLRRFLDG